MHKYYSNNRDKFKKDLLGYLKLISKELEEKTKKNFQEIFDEIWTHYEKNMLEEFPYIGGDESSGTKNLTGAFGFVSMGEVLKTYGVSLEETGYLMVCSYERKMSRIPGFVKPIVKMVFSKTDFVNKLLLKKDAKNEENVKQNPGSFITKTQIPPEKGCDISYHNLYCPLSVFAREHGYEEYMPYLCNLDYVMFGMLGLPLMREHTCFEDGDYCDFKTRLTETPLPYWPPVFTQENGYK